MSSQAKVDGSTAQLDMEDQPPSLPTPPKRQKASSFSNISRILVFALGIFIVGSIGFAGYSAFASRDIQQQNAVAVIREGPDNQGKAGKTPPPVCGSTVQCGGEAYTGEVKLTEDLFCTDTETPPIGGDICDICAITLDGEDAELDCNEFMVHNSGAMVIGICLLNGARAKNCYVQKFLVGIYVQNGGEVNECEVMFNDVFGIQVQNEASSTTKMKISNTYIHDNSDRGFYFLGSGESPESSETSIEVNNVKSNHNVIGMSFAGDNVKLEVQVKDSETSNNSGSGIEIDSVFGVNISAAVDVELDGIISRYNGDHGLFVSPLIVGGEVKVKVKGDVNLYKNENSGFFVGDVDVVVERRGALNSCGNLASGSLDEDIRSDLATFSGNGYTCDSTSPNLSNIITCDPCPTCPQ
mmetsp:Transcript_3057/g.4592  ORF Transcript_3057/g.4592 Transcript_3057/m.4592 type:complete len:411 (+) Transcript_3057:97-1329(+)